MAETRRTLEEITGLVPVDTPGQPGSGSDVDLDGDTLADRLRKLNDPQIAFNYNVLLPADVSDISLDIEVEGIDLNHTTVDVLPHHVLNTKEYYPGFADIPGFSMAYYFDIFGRAYKYNIDWISRYHNLRTGTYGLPSEYKRDVTVELHDVKGIVHMKHFYYGVWPSAIDPFRVEGEGASRLVLLVNYSVDGYIPEFVGLSDPRDLPVDAPGVIQHLDL